MKSTAVLTEARGQSKTTQTTTAKPSGHSSSWPSTALVAVLTLGLPLTPATAQPTGLQPSCEHISFYSDRTAASGYYQISPDGTTVLDVYCDMNGDSGWTVIDPNLDPEWSQFFAHWESFASGLVYGWPDGCRAWREWLELADRGTQFATSPTCQDIDTVDYAYQMTGNYYGCYWWMRNCDFDGTCHRCTDNLGNPDSPGTCPWYERRPDDTYCHNCGSDWGNRAPSIGANGTHCVAFYNPVVDTSQTAFIFAGEYSMGDHHDDMPDALPVHDVYVGALHMDVFEVTNQEYADFLNSAYADGWLREQDGIVYLSGGTEPLCDTLDASANSRIRFESGVFTAVAGKENHPVLQVSWHGAVVFATWKSEQEGRERCYNLATWDCDFSKNGYRLPTEAEWEYAARASVLYYRYPWGNDIDGSYANYEGSGDPYEQPHPGTTPVGYYDGGQVPAGSDMMNEYGLYDPAGNVTEWCHDWYGPYEHCDPAPCQNPVGPEDGTFRVARGGSWSSDPAGAEFGLRCADRQAKAADSRLSTVGFRLVRHHFYPPFLESWKEDSFYQAAVFTAEVTLGLASIAGSVCDAMLLACGGGGAVLQISDAIFADWIFRVMNDPPDPVYDVDVLPVFHSVPSIANDPPIPQTIFDAMVLLAQKAFDRNSYIIALLQAAEKYQGAEVAGDNDWMSVHQREVHEFALALANLTEEHRTLTQNLLSAMAAESWDPTLTPADVMDFQDSLAGGLPQIEEDILSMFGIQGEDRQAIINRLAAVNPNDCPPTVGAALTATLEPEADLADAFGAIADAAAPNPIPAVSAWGVAVMTLLVLTAGTLVYARRRPAQA